MTDKTYCLHSGFWQLQSQVHVSPSWCVNSLIQAPVKCWHEHFYPQNHTSWNSNDNFLYLPKIQNDTFFNAKKCFIMCYCHNICKKQGQWYPLWCQNRYTVQMYPQTLLFLFAHTWNSKSIAWSEKLVVRMFCSMACGALRNLTCSGFVPQCIVATPYKATDWDSDLTCSSLNFRTVCLDCPHKYQYFSFLVCPCIWDAACIFCMSDVCLVRR